MEMIDLKGKGDDGTVSSAQPDRPNYPWGFSINIESEVLEALGMDIKRYPVGTDVKINAIARVTGISMNEDEGAAKKSQCLRLQITKIAKPSVTDANRMRAGSDLLKKMRG